MPLADDFAVNVLNIPSEWFEAAQLDWRSLWRKEAVHEESPALPLFFQAYEAIRQNRSRLSQEQALLALHHAASGQQYEPADTGHERIERAVALLQDRFAEDASLTELAASVGLAPTYLCRAFKKAVGLTPHAYQNSLRVARAKTLLMRGESAGDVAGEVGFYDQSHLLRHFKRLLGTTLASVARGAISSCTSSQRQE